MRKKRFVNICMCILISLICMFSAAVAFDTGLSRGQIMNVDLGAGSLTLEVGESYTFDVKFEPANTAFRLLSWFTTDDSIVSVDSKTDTVTALRPGTVRIFAESFDHASGAYCDVTVSGGMGKDVSGSVSGADFVNFDDSDRAKIKSYPFNNFLSFISSSEFTPESLEKISERFFALVAEVLPGTEEEESAAAMALGMMNSRALTEIHMVTLNGTFGQIVSFIRNNANLVEIFGGEVTFLSDPAGDEIFESDGAKALGLQDHVEEITKISNAHNLGYTGKGTTIAVIDTGLNSQHEQFSGRVIREKCFSTNGPDSKEPGTRLYSVCKNNAAEADSAEPSGAKVKTNFNHGSHVAGIAAGRDGIAPDAQIVAVQVLSESVWECKDGYEEDLYSCSEDDDSGMCCSSTITTPDEMSAYNYLKSLKNEGVVVDVINMSYAFERYTGPCDQESDETNRNKVLTELYELGMIPVAGTGNECNTKDQECTFEKAFYFPSMIGSPACLSHVFGVGAMSDSSDNTIAKYSNISTDTYILAPGTNIYSAAYVYNEDAEDSKCNGINCYQKMNGTSMATPVAAGSFAVLKSAIPGKTPAEYGNIILEMSSNKTADSRETAYFPGHELTPRTQKFDYSRPVLNFVNFKDIVDKYNPHEPVLPTSLSLDKKTASINVGEKMTLTATILPDNADNLSIIWTNGDTAVVSIEESPAKAVAAISVTGLTEGVVTITASSDADPSLTDSCVVTVTGNNGGDDPQPPVPPFHRLGGEVLPRTGFSNVRPQALIEKPANVKYNPLKWSLEIPSLSVSANLVEVPFVDGEYPIEWLAGSVGLLEGFGGPGKGSMVLTGHNHLNTMEAGPFAFLSSMEKGERIFLHDAGNNVKVYVVYANEKVSETDFNAVERIAGMFDNTITMITCEDELAKGGYASRRIVAAKPLTD